MFCMANPAFSTENDARARAPAVGKAVRVLETVAAQEQPLGVSEIGRRTGLSKSTVHALVTSLLREGLLEGGRASGGYRLGHRLISLSQRAKDSVIVERAQPELRSLAQETQETVFLGKLVADRVSVLDREESARSLNLSAPVGSTVPVLAGALGKAYLGEIGAEAARQYLAHHQLPQFTEASILAPERLLSDARQAATRGYALDRGEYLAGVSAAACCLRWEGSMYFLWVVRIEQAGGPGLDTLGLLTQEGARNLQRSLQVGADSREDL